MVKDTRQRIVEAAMELFWLKGFGSTSIADILSRSQVNSGSLYYFFPGKQDVLIAVLEAYRDGIRPMLLEPAWAGVDDPVERVFALLARYRAALVDTDCTYGCPIGSLALELHEPDPPVRELIAANFRGWVEEVEACLAASARPLSRQGPICARWPSSRSTSWRAGSCSRARSATSARSTARSASFATHFAALQARERV